MAVFKLFSKFKLAHMKMLFDLSAFFHFVSFFCRNMLDRYVNDEFRATDRDFSNSMYCHSQLELSIHINCEIKRHVYIACHFHWELYIYINHETKYHSYSFCAFVTFWQLLMSCYVLINSKFSYKIVFSQWSLMPVLLFIRDPNLTSVCFLWSIVETYFSITSKGNSTLHANVGPTFFYCLFYGKIFKKIESGGLNKNKNKIHFLVESTIKIKIKLKKGRQIFIFRKTYFWLNIYCYEYKYYRHISLVIIISC